MVETGTKFSSAGGGISLIFFIDWITFPVALCF